MKRFVIAVALLAACSKRSAPAPIVEPPAAPAPTGPGTVETKSFHSDALGVDKHYLVYLPAGYATAPDRRYPVVYMLHGLGDNERGWVDSGKLDQTADALHLQAIVVMPDGDASFYVNVPVADDPAACAKASNIANPTEPAAEYCVPTPRYEDYMTRDLIAHVDGAYRTIATREGRGIGGLSMGGYGALELAMRHPDLYSAAASHSGVDSLLYAGPFPYQGVDKAIVLKDVTKWGEALGPVGAFIRSRFGTDLAGWREHDPATLATKLEKGKLALYLDCGSEDDLGLNNQAQYLHDVLLGAGIDHLWYLGPGGHNFGFWSQRIDDSLGFFAKALAPATP